ncbi:uncharacterized protein [Panulirus ornatus]|uniref:uncharacterized protein n=1 Tax=Panulirus ornatus TaxID=150431 RepID=UPI003A86AA5C
MAPKTCSVSMLVAGLVLSSLLLAEQAAGEYICDPPTDEDNLEHPVPDFAPVLARSFSLIVEMTDVVHNETYYVEEYRERKIYHDEDSDTVAVLVVFNGSTTIYHFYPEKNLFVEESGGQCHNIGNSVGFAPWGWYDQDPEHGPKSYGPSSILRLASLMNTKFIAADVSVGGVMTEEWYTCVEGSSIMLNFYYAVKGWDMPEAGYLHEVDRRVPVMFKTSIRDTGGDHWQYTVLAFTPFLNCHGPLETPRGMSCEGFVSVVADDKVPSIPWHFSMAEEIISNSEVDGQSFGDQHLDKIQMQYAGKLSLVGLTYIPSTSHGEISGFAARAIHDFNTGIQYSIDEEYGTCSMDFIPSFTFDSHYGGYVGTGDTLLGPNDLFHLDKTYAFIGERSTRGLAGDLWTSTRKDIPDLSVGGVENLPKAVLEYYFSQGMEVTATGRVPFKMPTRGDLFVYNVSNPRQVVATMTTNFYDFKKVTYFSEKEFSVEECFEKQSDQWSYLTIFFPADHKDQFTVASKRQDKMKHEILQLLVEIGSMSPVRIASIDITLGFTGIITNTSDFDMIIATIKMLDRAPYIYSFRKPEDEPLQFPGINEKVVENIHLTEDCAKICVDEEAFDCMSFHHCDDNTCFLSSLETTDGKPVETVSECHHWIYNIHNQTFQDFPSSMVFQEVLGAIRHGKFIFGVPYKNKTVGFEAKMSLHYRTPDPLDPVRQQFTFEARSMTVVDPDYILNVTDLNECLVACVGWQAFRCETVVHHIEEKKCLLIARHYQELNRTEVKPYSQSFIYSRTYLFDYTPILGGVSLNTSGPVYNGVDRLETCAMHCSTETSITCQSFEWCPYENVCHLHVEHYLDVVDGGNYTTNTSCIHFSKRTDQIFSRNPTQGLPNDKHKLVAMKASFSSCAKLCVEDINAVCESFDFCSSCGKGDFDVCGEENKGATGLCFLSTYHVGESGFKVVASKHCDHYSRNVFGDLDYASWIAQLRKAGTPYTSGDMTGLAFGMIFLGILLAIGFLLLMMNYKPASVPKDFAISFMTLRSAGESDI